MQYVYLFVLILSSACLLGADRRYKLAYFRSPRLVRNTVLAAVLFFLIWDITGIVLDVFSTNREWVSGLYLVVPDLPVEEIIFLAFLSYITILTWRLICSRIS